MRAPQPVNQPGFPGRRATLPGAGKYFGDRPAAKKQTTRRGARAPAASQRLLQKPERESAGPRRLTKAKPGLAASARRRPSSAQACGVRSARRRALREPRPARLQPESRALQGNSQRAKLTARLQSASSPASKQQQPAAPCLFIGKGRGCRPRAPSTISRENSAARPAGSGNCNSAREAGLFPSSRLKKRGSSYHVRSRIPISRGFI